MLNTRYNSYRLLHILNDLILEKLISSEFELLGPGINLYDSESVLTLSILLIECCEQPGLILVN